MEEPPSLPPSIELLAQLYTKLNKILAESLPDTIGSSAEESWMYELLSRICDDVFEDLWAYSKRDPAAGGNKEYVLQTYRSFQAVMHYRVAHAIATVDHLDEGIRRPLARHISERGKLESRVEIHPSAKIGPRFVVDHGEGTVIGETTVIGSDCYLLQGVVLGGSSVADNNPTGRRHPKLGNDVEIAAFAKILGAVTIGDHVFIGPDCVIAEDIPSGRGPKEKTRVMLVNQYQVTLLPKADTGNVASVDVFGVIPLKKQRIAVVGDNLDLASSISVVGTDDISYPFLQTRIIRKTNRCALLEITLIADMPTGEKAKDVQRARLKIDHGSGVTCVRRSAGLSACLRSVTAEKKAPK